MFKNPARKVTADSAPAAPAVPRFIRPKVLLIDVPSAALKQLRTDGFNVTPGSFGTPYRVGKSDKFQPMIGTPELANHREQEVVVVDLHVSQFATAPIGQKHTPDGEIDVWAKCSLGFIDPRVRAAASVCEPFDRILSRGGAFIVFAEDTSGPEIVTARAGMGGLYEQTSWPFDSWSFLSELESLTINPDEGREMFPVGAKSALMRLVQKHLPTGRFSCSIDAPHRDQFPWEPLAHNKFGDVVSVMRSMGETGTLIVVPQFADKAGFLAELFKEVLPDLAPHLFPENAASAWTTRPEYELSRIVELEAEQRAVQQRAECDVHRLQREIEKERVASGWLHDLIAGNNSTLVAAVKEALRRIGFVDVRDVDEERDKEGKPRREDLQIHDVQPVLVVDVKGLGGHPADTDAFQSHKHATLRIQEWKRFDVQALTIINHQRHMPPLNRDNQMPFRQEILDFATEVKMGVITAWDLYRFVRSAMKLSWTSEQTKPVLYRLGRIDAIPAHYSYLGTIDHVFTGVVSIQVEAGEIRLGNRIAFEMDAEFVEQEVVSLQVNKQAMENATAGTKAGTKTNLARPHILDGMRVFLVR